MALKPKLCLRESSGPNETECTFGVNFDCEKKVILSPKEGIFSEAEKWRWQNLLKSSFSFAESLESSNVERGPSENLVRFSMYEGHMETVGYTWLIIWCMLD